MGYTDKLGKRIQEDIAKYQNRRETVRASILEVLTVRFLSPDQMHPNPEDEFCDPEVGPNESIVEDYVDEARSNLECGADSFDEAILVAKMKDDHQRAPQMGSCSQSRTEACPGRDR